MKKILLAATTIIGTVLYSQAQTPVKRVLLEEFTTTLCGFCPPASKKIHDWHEANPNSIMITIHEGFGTDVMSNTFTGEFYNIYKPSNGSFAPAMMIDRAVYPWIDDKVPYISANGSGFDTIATRVMNSPAAADIQIVNGAYNSTTRALTATVNVKFVSTVVKSDYRVNLYLVEDNVTGGSAYDQKVYDSNWATTNYPTKFDGDQHIIGYPHRLVMRAALLTTTGSLAGIPTNASPEIGKTYTATATYTIPAGYNDQNLHLVATISRNGANSSGGTIKNLKYTLNAIDAKVETTFATSIENVNKTVSINNIYPVPSQGNVTLTYSTTKQSEVNITVHNVLGQIERTVISKGNVAAGNHEEVIDTKDLAKGIYYITIQSDNTQTTQKFIVN